MIETNHRHRAKDPMTNCQADGDYLCLACYSGCVATWRTSCDEGSHGNISYLEECECGAVRNVNANMGFEEHGEWYRPDDRQREWIEQRRRRAE